MIYEAIPLTRRRQTISPYLDPERSLGSQNSASTRVHLVTTSISTSILSTCRFLHDEAKVILGPRLQALRLEPPRMIIESCEYDPTTEDDSIPNYVLVCIARALYRDAENMTGSTRSHLSPAAEELRFFAADMHISRMRKHISAVQLKMVDRSALSAITRLLAIEQRKIEQEKLGISEDFSGAILRILAILTSPKPVPGPWMYNHWDRYYYAAFDPLGAASSLQLPVTVQYHESNLEPLSERRRDYRRRKLLRRCMLRNTEYTEPIDEEEWASKWAACESAEVVGKAE
jgi:hypothetical protein